MNPLLLQKQLKENNEDLQNFATDLKKWGEEMKRKEDALKGKVEPLEKKVKKSPAKVQTQNPVPPKIIGTTNYAAWDKFDVDAELEKLDNDTDEDSEVTDECNENMYEEAVLEKEKGNKFVKSQKWDDAIKCYTKAIDCYSYDPVFYANRALCYLKKNMYQEAEKDCNLSIKLDATYVKAHQRRAAARVGLNKLEQAEQDYLKVLEFEPKNKETLRELEILRGKLRKGGETDHHRPVSKFTASRNQTRGIKPVESQKEQVIDEGKPTLRWSSNDADDIIEVKPINKPPRLRSQKPLMNIKIDEIGNEPSEIINKQPVEEILADVKKSEQIEAQNKQPVIENIEPIRSPVEPIKSQNGDEMVSEFGKQQRTKATQASQHGTAWPQPNSTTLSIKSDDFKVIERKNPLQKNEKNTSNIKIVNNAKIITENINLAPPKSSVQFYLTWKNLKSTEEKYKYLKQIEPGEIPKIFLSSLESNIFSDIIEVMATHYIEKKERVSDVLRYFTAVKRFGAITMFLSDGDKKNLWKLFDYIKETEKDKDVDDLIKKYEL